MSDTLKVKGHAHLIRDLKSQAIINTDSDAYAKYMARKIKQKEKDDEVRQVVRDVNELRNEMREMIANSALRWLMRSARLVVTD